MDMFKSSILDELSFSIENSKVNKSQFIWIEELKNKVGEII
jgi:hypothetical protein